MGTPRASLGLAAGSAVAIAGTLAVAQTTERLSVDPYDGQVKGASSLAATSADGRFVAFESVAYGLVYNDSNGVADVFVRDRATATTERVSVDSAGLEANGESNAPALSADGRFVAFQSVAGNLVAGDTNWKFDIFVRDRTSGITERVSLSSAGAQADNDSWRPAISADGRFVAFGSDATNLVPGDSNGQRDVFVRDRQNGITERISVDSAGVAGNGRSELPALSADGRYVAFQSGASNLIAADTNGTEDVFLRDRVNQTTECVSVAGDGTLADNLSGAPALSADGRLVAFHSFADNLIVGDTNTSYDIFVRDRIAATTERASVDAAGAQVYGASLRPSLSADGRWVAFLSVAAGLVAGDTNGRTDVFIRDRVAATTVRVSVDSNGAQANGDSADASLSADGRCIAFTSVASNLVAWDTNGVNDIFARGPDLTLDIAPALVAAGATLDFIAWTGPPNGLDLLVVNAVNDVPLFVPVLFGAFDGNGRWSLEATVPAGLAGNTVTFELFGVLATGKVAVSNRATVAFQ